METLRQRVHVCHLSRRFPEASTRHFCVHPSGHDLIRMTTTSHKGAGHVVLGGWVRCLTEEGRSGCWGEDGSPCRTLVSKE